MTVLVHTLCTMYVVEHRWKIQISILFTAIGVYLPIFLLVYTPWDTVVVSSEWGVDDDYFQLGPHDPTYPVGDISEITNQTLKGLDIRRLLASARKLSDPLPLSYLIRPYKSAFLIGWRQKNTPPRVLRASKNL